MVFLFVLLGCNLSYIVDLFAPLHELASVSARTLLKFASSVHALLKPYGDTLSYVGAGAHLRALMTRKSCAIGMQNAIGNTLKSGK